MKFLTAVIVWISLATRLSAQVPIELRSNDTVTFCGDSASFSDIIGAYLDFCVPDKDIHVQIISGQRLRDMSGAGGDLVLFSSPNVVVMSFGLRGSNMQKTSPELLENYRKELIAGIQKFKVGGVRTIIVCSPTALDPDMVDPNTYETLSSTLVDITQVTLEVAREQRVGYVDIYKPMLDVVKKTKAAFGPSYQLTGPDLVFPTPNSSIAVAHAMLKAFGCDGNIGTIRLDLASGKATATSGHRVISSDKNRVEIESTKYPYCFGPYDPKNAGDPRSILSLVPFNADLNRFRLTVSHPPAERMLVQWGDQKKEFSAQQLEEGINLAEEFQTNPFLGPFGAITQEVDARKTYLGYTIRRVADVIGGVEQSIPNSQDACTALRKAIRTQWDIRIATTGAAPVRHIISLTAVEGSAK